MENTLATRSHYHIKMTYLITQNVSFILAIEITMANRCKREKKLKIDSFAFSSISDREKQKKNIRKNLTTSCI